MQNCPRQLAMQSCELCVFVRCGTSNQIFKKREKKKLHENFNITQLLNHREGEQVICKYKMLHFFSRNQWLRRRIVVILRQIIKATFGDRINR